METIYKDIGRQKLDSKTERNNGKMEQENVLQNFRPRPEILEIFQK